MYPEQSNTLKSFIVHYVCGWGCPYTFDHMVCRMYAPFYYLDVPK